MVEETLATIPGRFRLHARNPDHDVVVGDDHFCFANVITPPYASDLDRGRRPGTYGDFCELLKLCQSLDSLHMLYGYPVEPQDLAPETRHLDAYAAHIRLTQLANPGTPVIYGAFTTNVVMRSAAVAFGSPEFFKATIASGQLARRYRMPYKAAVTTGANVVDAQADYETQDSTWSAVMGGGNVIAHAAGFLESGLTTSYEKLVVDAEMMQMMMSVMTPIEFDDASLVLETIDQVGPGGHFFDSRHTLDRYEHAFYQPLVSDWSNHESWIEKGSMTTDQRANKLCKRLLEDYTPPALDGAIAEETEAYVERRRREILDN